MVATPRRKWLTMWLIALLYTFGLVERAFVIAPRLDKFRKVFKEKLQSEVTH